MLYNDKANSDKPLSGCAIRREATTDGGGYWGCSVPGVRGDILESVPYGTITVINDEAAYLLRGAPDRSGSVRGESPARGADSKVTPIVVQERAQAS